MLPFGSGCRASFPARRTLRGGRPRADIGRRCHGDDGRGAARLIRVKPQQFMSDAAIRPGWRHNPTDFRHRARLVPLAFAGLVIAAYLTLYQGRRRQRSRPPRSRESRVAG
jgi:hypothetical protein